MKMGVRRKRAESAGFWRIVGCHEHGMDRDFRFDDGPGAFKRQPQTSKGDPMSKSPMSKSPMSKSPMSKSPVSKSMNVKSLSVSLVLLMAGMSAASAQAGPTMQEKMACRSDAESLCAAHIGKPSEMNACLRENKAKLSVPCRKVVEARGG
jgi:hypothetical protein